jgi:hypothetical protein
MSQGLSHAQARRAIRAHFGRGNSQEREHSMFGHVKECEACRAVYQHYAAFAAVDPEAVPRDKRLLRGLGLSRQSLWPRWVPLTAVGAAAALAAVLLVAAPWHQSDDGFAVRGQATQANASELVAYRVLDDGAVPVVDRMSANDRLAFTYANPTGRAFLLVFAIDAAGEVYWYYPAWTSSADDPVAVPIEQTKEPVELGEAVRHALPTGTLQLVAAFVDRPWRVRAIEALLESRGPGEPIDVTGGTVLVRSIDVVEQ